MAPGDALGPVRDAFDGTGLNLFGVLSAERYDAFVPAAWRVGTILPAARSVVLVGAGGPALFAALERAPESRAEHDPFDRYTRRIAEGAAARLAGRALFAFERRGERYADFVALGRAVGLGAPSRLGLLLHPEYGPWMSLRALLLVPNALPETAPLEGFDPCDGCPAPCARACPGAALDTGRFDIGRCAESRGREPGCALKCDARRACVIGGEHRYDVRAEEHHMRHAALDNFA